MNAVKVRKGRGRRQTEVMKLPAGEVLVCWIVGETSYDVRVLARHCPMCFQHAVTELPPPELAKQTDGTTHVCMPLFGGCNHGFALEAPPAQKVG